MTPNSQGVETVVANWFFKVSRKTIIIIFLLNRKTIIGAFILGDTF